MLYPKSEVYAIGDSPNDFDMFPIAKRVTWLQISLVNFPVLKKKVF